MVVTNPEQIYVVRVITITNIQSEQTPNNSTIIYFLSFKAGTEGLIDEDLAIPNLFCVEGAKLAQEAQDAFDIVEAELLGRIPLSPRLLPPCSAILIIKFAVDDLLEAA